MNPLTTFSGNLSGLLPSLSIIDATGILHWKPDRQIFQLRMLRKIIGWTYSQQCSNCLLYRSNDTSVFTRYHSFKFGCEIHYRPIDNKSHFVQMLNNTFFQFHCKPNNCLKSMYIDHIVAIRNECWKTTLVIINWQSILGCLSAVFNITVVLTILTSKRLRNDISMRFVCNMAVSDFFVGVYIVSITIYLNDFSFLRLHHESRKHCWKVGFLWMLGQSGSAIGTFLLTLERYLPIVYSLRPELRIRGRLAGILIAICWFMSLVFTSYALYFNLYQYTFLCVPIGFQVVFDNFRLFLFTLIIGSLGLLLYLVSFLFYIHIYISTKRTAQTAGVKQESKIAKRISLLVFSNMFFFFLPVITIGIVMWFFNESVREYNTNNYRYYFLNIFPSLCLSINSCCNPVLHAFRHNNFKKALKKKATDYYEAWFRPMISRTRESFTVKQQVTPGDVCSPSIPGVANVSSPIFKDEGGEIPPGGVEQRDVGCPLPVHAKMYPILEEEMANCHRGVKQQEISDVSRASLPIVVKVTPIIEDEGTYPLRSRRGTARNYREKWTLYH